MVSTSDTAKQIQFSSLKQDAAEAAFKARHSFGSSDAFKQIFDGIDKTAKNVEAPKECTHEPVRSDAGKKIREKHHSHSSKPVDDSSDKHADCDMPEKSDKADKCDDAQTAPSNQTEKHAHSKKAHGKSSEHGCGHHHCDQDENNETADAEDTAQDAQTIATNDTPTDIIAVDTNVADQESSDVAPELCFADITDETLAQEQEVAATPVGDTDDKALPITGDKNLTPILLANLQGGLNIETADVTETKSAGPLLGNFQKAVEVPQKPAHEKTAAAKNDEEANLLLPDTLEAEAGLDQHFAIKEAKEEAKTEREAIKQANNKHADHIDFLQGKFSAPETHPAAGDRAISVAQKASDSSAPTLNGSAGGGSPMITKGAIISAVATGLAGAHSMQGDPQVTFAGTLRATKEAQTSMMAPNEQVAVHLNRMAKSGTSQYDLQLHPAELGRVDIRLEINKDGAVQATITADNQQAFDMLQKDSRSLERALQQAGLQTDSGSLSFSLRGDNGSQAQQHAQHNHGTPWNKWIEKTLPEEAIQSKILSFDVSAGPGRVDLRV